MKLKEETLHPIIIFPSRHIVATDFTNFKVGRVSYVFIIDTNKRKLIIFNREGSYYESYLVLVSM